MIKHQHNDFQSDLFVMFETVGAQLTLVTGQGKSRTVTMGEFLQTNMRRTVILNVMLPPLNKTYLVTTMKIMPKSQNAHAIVNAGFLYKLANNSTVTQARIVYNGISPTFVRALGTEKFLIGKPLFKNETLQSALNNLKKDLNATEMPPEPSAAYRQQLGLAMFYKGLLYFCSSNNINPRYLSGATFLRKARPLSRGEQNYETNSALWPLNQPIPKLESLIQCAGEAEYVDDIPSLPYEVFGAFVLSTVALGQIASIDASEALKIKGVIAFYTAKDIPGKNSFIPKEAVNTSDEEILCSGDVKYYNQPLGIIVAEYQHIAVIAAKNVKIKYTNIRKPVLDISDAIRDPKRNSILTSVDATTRGHDTTQVVKGNATIYGQYHFSMEILVCVTLSTEEGLQVYPSVQNMDGVQAVISKALNLDANRIDIKVRRLGGSYGIKVTRSNQVAVSCSLVSFKLNRPCRFVLPLSTTTRAYGKRFPCIADMEAGINRSGIIQYLNFKLYEDNGYKVNEIIPSISRDVYNNCYEKSTWSFQCINTITDTAKNSWFRAPGTLEAVSFVELFMDRIAYEANLDPIELRLANLDPAHKDLREMLDTLIKESKYKERRKAVEIFNKNNRWLKKGLRFSFLKWASTIAPYFDVNISVYHVDGTVSLTHGGIEMGQGINTKAAQICAYFLKVPLEKVQVKATNTNICPNSSITAGSFTILSIGIGVERSCKDLLQRLEPIRSKMPDATWQELIAKAFEENVDLQAHGFVNRNDVVAQKYNIYGITLSEVLIDVLTGEYEVLRVDILEDVGQSVSPEIDVGQIEGAFIMGLGYWTTERLVYDKKTGELLTDTSWTYYVPQARDIPQDMRVYFRKNSYSNRPSFGSKMTGEPPMCMTISVPLAIREAITSARRESGIPSTQWFDIDGPYNLESVCLSSATDIKYFKFY
ncbi:xanthine dehydrogenase/oxidase-like [Bombyx mandarina]|uniref:Xanthine dehydrogenase/oxidase-like n=1 Tax=Bombyx mandarina TaxID=7092 RepID=A0A6J2KBC4_BOMMA|nr:xanthine dehydrogenase/oxidase-like [Bombyx mandarina]